MIRKSLLIAFITTLLRDFLVEGEEIKRYDFKASTALSRTTGEVKADHNSFSTAKEGKTPQRPLNGKFEKKNARANENLVRQLALSSKISPNERLLAEARRKEAIKRTPKNTNQPKNDLLQLKNNRKHSSKVHRTYATHKRASITVPSQGRSVIGHRHPVRVTPAFLTALAMLLDKRNHFEKDSDALTLARVLVNNGSFLKDGQTSLAKTKDRFQPLKKVAMLLGGISSLGNQKLRLQNSSLIQTTVTGERKSTIHTELINPTELGVSILRLLFGNRAPLVMKSRYKPLLEDNASLRVAHPTISSLKVKTVTRVKQFERQNGEPNRIVLDKKRRLKSFSFALAKAVSDIIKSMAKKDLDDYFHKLNHRPKPSKGLPSQKTLSRYWPSTKKVDVKGNRKSWVLLKIPKVNDGETIDQKTLADMPREDEQAVLDKDETELDPDEEQEVPGGVVDTLGKLNDAENVQNLDKNLIGGLWRSTTKNGSNMISDSPVEPTARVGYSVRVLPSLRGRSTKQTDHDHTTIRPANNADPTANNAATFTLAVKKLLQAVQSSIKTLQGKHLIRSPSPTHKPVDPVPRADTNMGANTGSIRGMNTKKLSQYSKQKDPFVERLEEQTSPSLGELTALKKVTPQDDPLGQANVIFDPLKDLENLPSDPITKSNSPTKSMPGPSENVLFESNTELGAPKDRQESSTIKHLKEDLETFAEKGLEAHNRIRRDHHSPPLRWSDELATQAEKLAYDMATRGTVERSEVATSEGYGENVAKITGVSFNDAGSVAADVWYSESSNYSYSYPRLTPQTDAFTQLIWRGTKEIGMGCAKDVATNDLYVVALYRPPGNDRRLLRTNVINKGTMTEDVYATIFKRAQMRPT